jgi:DNA-binding CsgD family transcriptional regulator
MQGWFLLFDLVSVLFGVAAEMVVLVLYLKIRSPKLLYYLIANLLTLGIVAILAFDSFTELTGIASSLRGSLWESIEYFCCCLCFVVPRMRRSSMSARLSRLSDIFFDSLASLVIFALAYCSARRVARPMSLYVAPFVLLTLALLFFAICQFPSRGREHATSLRHYHRFLDILGVISLALLPVFVIVDFFGWILPWPGASLPRGLSILPAFLIMMSLGIVCSSVLEILEPPTVLKPNTLDPALLDAHKISKREAEILPLLLQCLTYKEIGERLFITSGTVRTHVVHIYQKTGVSGRLELARLLAKDSVEIIVSKN